MLRDSRTHQNVFAATGGRCILEIQRHQMLSEPPIERLVCVVQDEIEQVETRDQRGREVDILCHCLVRVVL